MVTHLNHRLRGADADADAAFVAELAGRLGLTVRLKEVDVATEAAGANLEAAARRARYEFFAETAAEVGAGWVATGHTADDQAETVLHRLIRGAGLQGLRGVQRVRGLGGAGRSAGVDVGPFSDEQPEPGRTRALLIRPLLGVTRADVLEYLAALDQPYRTDASNADPRFTRNRLRHEVVPLLKTFNPDVVRALSQLADQAGEAFEVLEADAARLLAESERPRAGGLIVLDPGPLATAQPYRVREVMRLLWRREGWSGAEMTARHWSRLGAVATGRLGAGDFPGGIRARRVGRVLQIGPGFHPPHVPLGTGP